MKIIVVGIYRYIESFSSENNSSWCLSCMMIHLINFKDICYVFTILEI